ncbi:unnamed protein product [Urochloa humidicola]
MQTNQEPNSEAAATNPELNQHIPDIVSSLPSSKGLFGIPLYRHAQGWHASHVSMSGAMVADACFAARPSDIIVATLPKSGTTWIKSLLYATVRRREHPVHDAADHPLSSSGPHECVRFLESQLYAAHDKVPDLAVLPDPRLFATHVPFASLPRSVPAAAARIVYVCRDPKDTLVSLWAFHNKLRHDQPPLSVDAAAELFCDGVSPFGPYWEHVLGYWRAHLVLFFRYEEMRRDPAAHVRRLAEFAGLPFGGAAGEEEDAVVRLCSFERMSGLEVTRAGKTEFAGGAALDNSSFFRRGVVGDWTNHLSVEMARRIDTITEAKFKGSGVPQT